MRSSLIDRVEALEGRAGTDRTSNAGRYIVIVEDGETAEDAAARGYREHGPDARLVVVEGADGVL